ncbi:hypothetical protein FRC18_006057, partial [Serendipita sp. 400]
MKEAILALHDVNCAWREHSHGLDGLKTTEINVLATSTSYDHYNHQLGLELDIEMEGAGQEDGLLGRRYRRDPPMSAYVLDR